MEKSACQLEVLVLVLSPQRLVETEIKFCLILKYNVAFRCVDLHFLDFHFINAGLETYFEK